MRARSARSSAVPVLEFPVEVGVWVAALVELRGDDAPLPRAVLHLDESAGEATVEWPDGVRTASRLLNSDPATAADR